MTSLRAHHSIVVRHPLPAAGSVEPQVSSRSRHSRWPNDRGPSLATRTARRSPQREIMRFPTSQGPPDGLGSAHLALLDRELLLAPRDSIAHGVELGGQPFAHEWKGLGFLFAHMLLNGSLQLLCQQR